MIDFHCHLDLYPDPHEVARRCEQMGIYVLSVTTTPSAWEGTSALERGRIRTALGLHPQLAHERIAELELFDQLLAEVCYVGEIGLDGAPDFKKSWDKQLKVFDHILSACTAAGGRILSVHSRRAAAPVLDRLEAYPDSGTPILHWFTGTLGELGRAKSLGCWFSIGPPMLESARARELIARVPRHRVVTESDGPFARLSGTPAYPWDTGVVVRGLAEIWECDEATAHETLEQNLRALTAPTERA